MTVEMDTDNISEEKVTKGSQVADNVRFDWIVIALSTWLVLGGYSDAWAHNHVPSLETFPVVLYLRLFPVRLKLTTGVNWTIHLWLGTTFVAGIASFLLSFLLVPPEVPEKVVE